MVKSTSAARETVLAPEVKEKKSQPVDLSGLARVLAQFTPESKPKPQAAPQPRNSMTNLPSTDIGKKLGASATSATPALPRASSAWGFAAQAKAAPEGIFDDITDFVKGVFGSDEHSRHSDRLAEDREERPTVAVIDYFDRGSSDKPTHGEKVESILMDASGLSEEEIQRYNAGGGGNIDPLLEASPEEFQGALDTYIEDRITGLLDGSSDALEDILSDEDSAIRTVNQSLGAPESRIAGDIAAKLDSDPEFRARFLEYAGLPEDATEQEVMQALVDEVGASRRSNENIQEAKERYDSLIEEAWERDITVVDSSGNYGRFADRLEELGVETDPQFHTDVLNHPLVLSVGATDDQGTASVEDDTTTPFSSPRAGADVAAPGDDVSTTIDGEVYSGDGTSFAAPQASAAAAILAERYPELSAGEIRSILRRTAINPGLESNVVGSGVIQLDEALELAEEMAA